MEAKQYKPFAADIKAHGLKEPICLFEGAILDGRHRYQACKECNYTFVEEDFILLAEGEDPIEYIKSHNLHKRHLTESQRGMVAAKLASLNKLGANQHTKQGPSIEEASTLLAVGKATTERAKAVLDKGVPKLVELVEQGKVKASVAEVIAKKPSEEQVTIITGKTAAEIVASIKPKNASDIYDEIEKKLIKQLAHLKPDGEAAASKTIKALQTYIASLQKAA